MPHPRLIRACGDVSVIGAAFYLMEPIDGFNAAADLPAFCRDDEALQRTMGLALADAIAAVGNVDYVAAGLEDLGRPDGWLERQVGRWLWQLESYTQLDGYPGSALPDVDRVAGWLEQHRPGVWSPGLMHGDYHFGNVLFRPDASALAAIVDWELVTIGDPLVDLGHLLALWPQPASPPGTAVLDLPGLPSCREMIARYGETSTRDLSTVTWYQVLACFRLGIILEGTHARACAGQAPRETGDLLHGQALGLFVQALALIGEHPGADQATEPIEHGVTDDQ